MLIIFRVLLRLLKIPHFKFHLNLNMMLTWRASLVHTRTRDVTDAKSFRPTWHGRDAYIHDHCLRYLHNYALFYQLLGNNLFTHRNTCYLERSHLWNRWPPGLFLILLHLFYSHRISFTILQSLLSNLYNKNTKNIYFIISIRSHFCEWPWRDWQPIYRVGCKVLDCLCRY